MTVATRSTNCRNRRPVRRIPLPAPVPAGVWRSLQIAVGVATHRHAIIDVLKAAAQAAGEQTRQRTTPDPQSLQPQAAFACPAAGAGHHRRSAPAGAVTGAGRRSRTPSLRAYWQQRAQVVQVAFGAQVAALGGALNLVVESMRLSCGAWIRCRRLDRASLSPVQRTPQSIFYDSFVKCLVISSLPLRVPKERPQIIFRPPLTWLWFDPIISTHLARVLTTGSSKTDPVFNHFSSDSGDSDT